MHIHLDPRGTSRIGSASSRSPHWRRKPTSLKTFDHKGMADSIVLSMDKMGVEKAILMPPPQVPSHKKGAVTYEDYSPAIAHHPGRLYPGGGGGVLNPLIYTYDKNKVTGQARARFRKEAEKLVRSGVVVFGEMSALHLSMKEGHMFAQTDPDHPLFLLLADIAAENDIPIDLHMEAVTEDIPTPLSLLQISTENPPRIKNNIASLSRLLDHNRKARIVWQHIGWDNIGHMSTGLLSGLLDRHPNLYLAIRVEYRHLKMDKSAPMPNRIVDAGWTVRPEWKKFINKYSDRIVVGSDDFMGLEREKSRPKDSFIETWSILEQFPKEVARKIGRDNALRIYSRISRP